MMSMSGVMPQAELCGPLCQGNVESISVVEYSNNVICATTFCLRSVWTW